MELNEELRKKLGDISELPEETKALAILDFLEKAMKFYNLSWMDFAKVLKGKTCLVCASKIQECSNCKNPIAVSLFCLRCGSKIQIEPSHRKP